MSKPLCGNSSLVLDSAQWFWARIVAHALMRAAFTLM